MTTFTTTKFPAWMPLYSDNTISESLPRSPEPSIIETACFVRACSLGFRGSAVDSLACLTSNGRTAGRTHKLAREILANTRRVPKREQVKLRTWIRHLEIKRKIELECLLMLELQLFEQVKIRTWIRHLEAKREKSNLNASWCWSCAHAKSFWISEELPNVPEKVIGGSFEEGSQKRST